ncbi:MAG: 3'(2'),5'-bisphosphate nucleotidase CysQ [Gammaproteobacteria bacterium]|nr:3'(2'),5'-bisphosphate nucleotidase CysQ [Gammaproteobacteria bacterium]
MSSAFDTLLPRVMQIAFSAGDAILKIYQQESYAIQTKNDASPVTQADILAHEVIEEDLSKLTPDIPLISEEGFSPSFEERKGWPLFWLVDPLDGTKEFIAHTDEFSVNIALIQNHEPILGVIVSPCRQTAYYASVESGAFFKDAKGNVKSLTTRKWLPNHRLSLATSRRHNAERMAELMSQIGDYSVLTMGSSLKFCAIAEQKADLYPRLGPTSEWDTAAGQCILTGAGGAVVDLQGLALRYNTKEDMVNPGFFATGDLDSLLKYLHLIQGKL